MPSIGQRAAVGPIWGEPSPHGLLHNQCIEVVNVTDVHQLNGTDLRAAGCGGVGLWQDCAPQSTPPFVNPASKTFHTPDECSFEPITVTSGVECSVFGESWEEAQLRALEQLRLGESRGLEGFFMERWLCPTAAANDLTPVAGALSVTTGIGVLENWLATEYGGRGVLHVPAGAASALSHVRAVGWPDVDFPPRTLAGNCVVLGAGYAANLGPADPGPGCEVAPAGEAWLYATPPVRIRRDDRTLTTPNEASSINTRTNDRLTLAESTFVVEVACCIAAAVRVDISCPN